MKITKRLLNKIDKCQSVYLIVCYAHWCVGEYKWTGKWVTYQGKPCPEVWYYNDHNGEYEEYVKVPITYVTTGTIQDWSFYAGAANRYAKLLEQGGF